MESIRFNDVSFNQDDSCFSLSTNIGFKIYNTFPLQCKLVQQFDDWKDKGRGIGKTRMLNRSNYIALVGGGKEPRYPLNRLVIWDDLVGKESIRLNFMSMIRYVYLSRCFIVVVLDSKICLYSFGKKPVKLIEDIDILSGSFVDFKSTSSSNDNSSNGILCFESNKYRGQIHVMNLNKILKDTVENQILPTMIIKAHKSEIQLIKLNHQGSMVATCSKKGTLIRIFNVHNGTLIREFRRGLDNAEIYDMEFSPKGSKLALISNKQTLHIFQIFVNKNTSGRRNSNGSSNQDDESDNMYNKKLQSLNNMIPKQWGIKYLDSVWSMCSIHLRNPLLSITNAQAASMSSSASSFEKEFEKDTCKIGWCNFSTLDDGTSQNESDEDNSEDSLVLVWKNSGIWEKYVILEKSIDKESSNDSSGPVKYYSVNESLRNNNMNDTNKHKRKWAIVRESWREL